MSEKGRMRAYIYRPSVSESMMKHRFGLLLSGTGDTYNVKDRDHLGEGCVFEYKTIDNV